MVKISNLFVIRKLIYRMSSIRFETRVSDLKFFRAKSPLEPTATVFLLVTSETVRRKIMNTEFARNRLGWRQVNRPPTCIFILRHYWYRNTRTIRRRYSVCARARVCVDESPGKTRWKYTGVMRDREHSVPRHRHTHTCLSEYVYIYLRTHYVWMCVWGIIHVFR